MFFWANSPKEYQLNGVTFGTYYKVIVYLPRWRVTEQELQAVIQSTLRNIDDEFSTYRSDSWLTQFNALVSTDWVDVSDTMMAILYMSKDVYAMFNGAWDPTIGPVSKQFGFGGYVSGNITEVGFDGILVDASLGMRKIHPNYQLDFSSIVKGYAVDRVMHALESQFHSEHVFVDIGGEIKVSGSKPNNQPWFVGIQSPFGADVSVVLRLNNRAVATSGNYANQNQQGVGHILDPRTQSAITHDLVSVSVVHASCAIADALATGLFVLGVDEAKRWLSVHRDVQALLITQHDSVYFNGMSDYLQE